MRATLGADAHVDEGVRLGTGDGEPPRIGDRARLRSGTVVYDDVRVGDDFATGHNVLVREGTTVGDDVLFGTNTVVDGRSEVGSRVSLQTRVYVPSETVIGDGVFVGPGAVLTNDPYLLRRDVELRGPRLEDDVSVGANATVLPGVTLGTGSFVAAGAVVTGDVPPESLAVGAPAECSALPERLRGRNRL
ncbi:acyltransferase [Halomarina ordinaria]|uniref:DapH/DapD/GlmU-related protein n=1 Tax=Halomarina ordinaria TaxID=3033939 RepID=A0ABD5U6G4_9EURY|nr:acyltransferase [Halomarina sp. PSRA2]